MKELYLKLNKYLGSFLTIVFIVLKLTGVIQWPWLWVLSPIWIPLCIVIAVFVIGFPIYCHSNK